MISIIDSSHEIYYNNEKTNNELLKTINATVNHEIRNPLNSIVAYNVLKIQLIKEMKEYLNDPKINEKTRKHKFEQSLNKFDEGNEV